MFLVVQSGDTLGVDTTGVADDTSQVLKVYAVPEIIAYDHEVMNLQMTLLSQPPIVPDPLDFTIKDAFRRSSCGVIDRGLAAPAHVFMPGTDTRHVFVSYNGHGIEDPLSGVMNINLLPVRCIRAMTVGTNGYGIPRIDITGNIVTHDRPFSRIGFTTGSFGLTEYAVELARPIDDECGLAVDGLYRKADGYRAHDDNTIGAFGANIYDHHFLPMRLDALFSSASFGYPDLLSDTVSIADQRLIDVSYATGIPGHNLFLLFTDYRDEWHDSLLQRTAMHSSRSYGLGSDHGHTLGPLQVLYGATGLRREIASDIYGTHAFYSLIAAATINATYNTCFATLSAQAKVVDSLFSIMPFFGAGLTLAGAWTAYGSIARRERLPVLAETAPLIDSTFGAVATNGALRAESNWTQEIGLRSPKGSISLFRHDFARRIVITEDSAGLPRYVNSEPWENMGASGAVMIPVDLVASTDTATYTRLQLGAYGYALLNDDTIIPSPRYSVTGIVMVTRQTPRFGLLAAAFGTAAGPRHTAGSEPGERYSVLALCAGIRFITLSITARLDNVFDVAYYDDPDYPLAPRAFSVDFQWDFWY